MLTNWFTKVINQFFPSLSHFVSVRDMATFLGDFLSHLTYFQRCEWFAWMNWICWAIIVQCMKICDVKNRIIDSHARIRDHRHWKLANGLDGTSSFFTREIWLVKQSERERMKIVLAPQLLKPLSDWNVQFFMKAVLRSCRFRCVVFLIEFARVVCHVYRLFELWEFDCIHFIERHSNRNHAVARAGMIIQKRPARRYAFEAGLWLFRQYSIECFLMHVYVIIGS